MDHSDSRGRIFQAEGRAAVRVLAEDPRLPASWGKSREGLTWVTKGTQDAAKEVMWGSRSHTTLRASERTLAFTRRWEPLEGLGEKEGHDLTYILEGTFSFCRGQDQSRKQR